MKTSTRLALFGLMIGAIGTILSLMIYGSGIVEAIMGDYKKVNHRHEFNVESVDEININAAGAEVYIKPIEGNVIKVDFDAKIYDVTNIEEQYDIIEKDNQLNIELKMKKRFTLINFANDIQLTIYLPKKRFEKINIDSSVSVLKVDSIFTNEMFIKSNAGFMEISEIDTNDFRLDVNAGSIELNHVQGNIDADINVGKIEATFNQIEHDVRMNVDAGIVDIVLKEEPTNLAVSVHVDGGKSKVDLPLPMKNSKMRGVIGNGDYMLNIKVDAGSFNLSVD